MELCFNMFKAIRKMRPPLRIKPIYHHVYWTIKCYMYKHACFRIKTTSASTMGASLILGFHGSTFVIQCQYS